MPRLQKEKGADHYGYHGGETTERALAAGAGAWIGYSTGVLLVSMVMPYRENPVDSVFLWWGENEESVRMRAAVGSVMAIVGAAMGATFRGHDPKAEEPAMTGAIVGSVAAATRANLEPGLFRSNSLFMLLGPLVGAGTGVELMERWK